VYNKIKTMAAPITVEKLIEYLQTQPKDAYIVRNDSEYGDSFYYKMPELGTINEDGWPSANPGATKEEIDDMNKIYEMKAKIITF